MFSRSANWQGVICSETGAILDRPEIRLSLPLLELYEGLNLEMITAAVENGIRR
jgi:hypothetical protein